MAEHVVGDDNKNATRSHVTHLFSEKCGESMSGRMVTTCHGIVLLFQAPRGGVDEYRDALTSELLEEGLGAMSDVP